MKSTVLLFCIILIGLLTACNKDEDLTFDPNAKLNFSSDSVLFDTVFTSVGSSSRRLKIHNPNLKAINIETIRLSGGNASAFSLNINGLAAPEANNLKINGNDSINVFVKVNINPTAQNLPFIVEDSVLFYFNGKKQSIPLVAYGQNAIFIKDNTITTNTTWNSRLPYLIYKSVTVAKDVNLTLEPGTRILFHGNSTMSIEGTLTAKGNKTDSILFASDRLEKLYNDESGQWNGIHFYPDSKNSQLNYAVVKNAIAGITVDSLSINSNPKLLLTNSVVKNMEVVGLLGYQTEITAFNNLFFNCGQYLLYGAGGGTYNLKQNTFAGYNINFARKTAAVYLSDYISSTQSSNLSVDLCNNIIWGNLTEEFLIDKKSAATTVTTAIKNNLIKTMLNTYNNNGNILNVDPSFIKSEKGNFRLNKLSAASNKGFNLSGDPYFSTFIFKDLDNKVRLFPSELGCYENN
jgi:HD superfamily phosphohydrolase YqeK